MTTHNPQDLVESLRNHLADPNAPLSFLLGAGASCAVPQKASSEPLIPNIQQLTTKCQDSACAENDEFSNAWKALSAECELREESPNIENILSRIIMKKEAVGEGETLCGLTRSQLTSLENIVRQAIVSATAPPEDSIPTSVPHDSFANWLKLSARRKAVELFTTNYDVLIERSLERQRVPMFDGFVGGYLPFFHSESIDDSQLLPPAEWVRVWKLHGSVNWEICDRYADVRIIKGDYPGSGQTILPSYLKYHESRKMPYTAIIDRFSKTLNQDNSLLITCGYSFGDQHLNSIIYTALDTKQTSNVVCLRFGNISPDDELAKIAQEKPNLTVVGQNGGVISGKWGNWKLLQPLSQKTNSFMRFVFKNDPPEKGQEATPLTGQVLLGDFNSFCGLLKTMLPRGEAKNG
jgi:hypothetical protein